MSEQVRQNELQNSAAHGTVATYVAGFVLSVALTLVAYALVVNQALASRNLLIGAIIGLAVVQFVVQMVFFLHLGRERRPRFNLVVFSFMLVVLFILVLGTLWIMSNLDYHTLLPPEELEQRIIEDEGY
ncbi:MAG: cytochrome o ubiquinol oxidase subunit IV [Candidatus Saccharimonadales bacterium]